MNYTLDSVQLENYFHCEIVIGGELERFQGFRVFSSTGVDGVLQVNDLEPSQFSFIDNAHVKYTDADTEDRAFLARFFAQAGPAAVELPDAFLSVQNLQDAARLAAQTQQFVKVEGGADGDFDICEFRLSSSSVQFRDVYSMGEVDDDWATFSPSGNVRMITFYDRYVSNLQRYVTKQPVRRF